MRDRSEELDAAIDSIDAPTEVHVHKDYWGKVDIPSPDESCNKNASNDVVEKALGSTKQVGTYQDIPVYSHGRADKDAIFTGRDGERSEGDRVKGWFKHIPGSDDPVDPIPAPQQQSASPAPKPKTVV